MEPVLEPTSPDPARTRARQRGLLSLAVAALALWTLLGSLFTVDVTEYGLVVRFGDVVRVEGEPGLHVKLPFDRVVRLERRLIFSQPPQAEYLTVDKKNIVVESLVNWRIGDPQRFLATLTTRSNAETRLADIMIAEIGSVLGTYPATSLIAPDGATERFRRVVSAIQTRVAGYAQTAYGIEVVDVELLRLTLPNQNREHVFERMKAERGKMAKEYRTEGERQARKIIAEADREKTHIEAEAYAKVQRLKGEGDAEASQIYAAAFSHNPAFYKFLRTLQAYGKFVDESTTLFLPGDAEVLRMLNPSARPGSSSSSAGGSVMGGVKPQGDGVSELIDRHNRSAAESIAPEDGPRGVEPGAQ